MDKNELIVDGTYKEFLQCKKELFEGGFDTHMKSLYVMYFDRLTEPVVDECFKIYNANHQRKYNNWNEICKWVFAVEHFSMFRNFRIVFGTLTFTDKVLDKTCRRTRARYVTKFLNKETFHYIANIDFGTQNDREHYHFIAMIEKKMDLNNWKYGGNKVDYVPIDSGEIQSVKNYLLKLNNHSYKESTKQHRIIRDRNRNKIVDHCANIMSEEFHKFKLSMTSF